MEHFLLSRL
jgi:hypothetical protein